MTLEWRHVLPISEKIRVRRNRHEYSFQDKTDWFQQNMQIEHDYLTPISVLEVFEILENLEKLSFLFFS